MPQADLPNGPSLLSPHAWLLVHQPSRYYAWLRRRYGDVATIRLPGMKSVIVLSSEGARQVFSADPETYDPFLKDAFAAFAGPGSIWALDGERHRHNRLLLLSAFSASRVAGYGRTMKNVTREHTDAWQPGQTIRAYDVTRAIARDIILRIGFGIDRGTVLEEGRRIVAELMRSGNALGVFIPAFRTQWFRPWKRFRRARNEFSMFVARQLADRRTRRGEPHDVLGWMLAARRDDGTGMTDDEICDALVPVMFAGHQTTSIALSWALYELGRHPAVLARLREELDALGADPDADVIARQPYLRAVCDETLRLHSLSEVARVTRVPRQLLGHAIPSGTGIVVSLSAIHHDASIFPMPAQFQPERFLERSYGPFEYVRFGGGHRRCPGAVLAEYEMPVVLATIATRWDFESAGEEREARFKIEVGPSRGAPLLVKERRGGMRA
jgi:cytochrome P450